MKLPMCIIFLSCSFSNYVGTYGRYIDNDHVKNVVKRQQPGASSTAGTTITGTTATGTTTIGTTVTGTGITSSGTTVTGTTASTTPYTGSTTTGTTFSTTSGSTTTGITTSSSSSTPAPFINPVPVLPTGEFQYYGNYNPYMYYQYIY